jgi:monofunctional biosynthetic peptidoglycan transglycosylase
MKVFIRKIWKWIKRIVIAFFAVSILSTIAFRFIPVPATPLMVIRAVEQSVSGALPSINKDWVSMNNISPHLVLAVISAEDQKFTQHYGFDFEAIEKVLKQNERLKKRGKPIKGGSTISQQCAKNVFLFPQRSYLRKGLEVYFTFLIELLWSKKRIMEVYLNVIEMGDGIYGAQAASKNFFKKDAKNLTISEAALIAAVLPNPRKWNAAKPTRYITKRQRWIMRQMRHLQGTVEL